MKIVLIAPLAGQTHGLKSLSSYLKSQGHQVKLIFLRSDYNKLINKSGLIIRYDQSVINEVISHCKECNLVGITVMTVAFDMAIQLTEEIKKQLNIPVIWGGTHPTVRPEECLKYADMVCLGEGELSLSELLHKMEMNPSSTEIKGIWFRKDGHIVKNSIRNLIEHLDSLPLEDFEIQEHLVLEEGKLIYIDRYKYYQGQYSIISSRGCYYNCTYCTNSYLKNLYGNKVFVRKRSIPHFIGELKEVITRYPNIKKIWFDDSSFVIRTVKEFELFKELYKKEINLPFSCECMPRHVQKEKIELLVSAGMDHIQFGMQTTTPRILDLYKRPCHKEDILKASKIVREVSKGRVLCAYDIILENPYEKDEELVECLKFLMLLPRPYTLTYYKLTFFPSLELTEKARKDGILDSEAGYDSRKNYCVPKATYINSLFYLMKFFGVGRIPTFMMTFFLNKTIIKLLNNTLTTAVFELISKIRTQIKYEH